MTNDSAQTTTPEHVFYTYVRNGTAIGLLAGPFDTREQADVMVEPARVAAAEIDLMSHFFEFGALSVVRLSLGALPCGKFNRRFGLPWTTAEISVADWAVESLRMAIPEEADPQRAPKSAVEHR